MKKTWAVALTAAIAASTLVVAAPAHAQSWPVDCIRGDEPPTPVTVDPNTLQVRIDPGALPEASADWAVSTAFCLENNMAYGRVYCFATLPLWMSGREYVYEDPNTGEIVVDGGRLANDAPVCVL